MMKAFIYPADGYVGRSLGPLLVEQRFEVLGGTWAQQGPDYVSTSYQIGSDGGEAAARQLLQAADVIVYHLPGNEIAARAAVVFLSKQPGSGRPQTFVCISTPLAWATTRPVPPELWPGGALDLGAGEVEAATCAVVDWQQSGLAAAADGTAPGSTAAVAGTLTDADVPRRSCGAAGREALELEHVVLRGARRGRLATYVICPGLLYGAGEDEDLLHPLFRSSWCGEGTSTAYGPGNNRLPMVHVADLAAYVVAVAASHPPQQYLLVADGAASTQVEVVRAVSESLGGSCNIRAIPQDELLFCGGPEHSRFMLDLHFTTSVLPPTASYVPAFNTGLVANISAVAQQYLEARGVTPLRIVLSGPPMVGKSALGAQLSRLYRLPHLMARDLLDGDHPGADPELLKALSAELCGRDGRVSHRTMAGLLRHVTASARNRGYILDGVPSSFSQAKHAFMRLEPMTPEELSLADREAALLAASTPGAGRGNRKEDKGRSKGTVVAGGTEEPAVPHGMKLVPDKDVFPTHLVLLQADETELRQRLAVVAAAELDAARTAAATAAATPGSKPLKAGADAAVKTHNNEKDFARRLEAHSLMQRDDEEDLQKKVAAAQLRWQVQQREAADREARELAEANTLKAKRRRAKALAASQALQANGTTSELGSPTATSLLSGTFTKVALGEDSDDAGHAAAEGPELPEFGGLVGLLASHGAAVTLLPNPNRPTGIPTQLDAWRDTKLPAAESTLCQLIGPPHNFDGFPDESAPPPQPSVNNNAACAAEAAAETVKREAQNAEMHRLCEIAKVDSDAAHAFQNAHAGIPLHAFLMTEIMPTVTGALITIARDRPANPLQLLVDALRAEADKRDEKYYDPYTHESYAIQAQKLVAKAERDAFQKEAAEAKAEREAAARVAAMQQVRQHAATPEQLLAT